MSVSAEIKTRDSIEIIDDCFSMENKDMTENLDANKLQALKDKMAAKNQTPKTEMKTRSIRLGIVGSGQAGSRIAASFYAMGYDTVVFNTASVDLEHIKVPEENKYLLDYGLGGAAKELEIGRSAAEAHRDEIHALIDNKLDAAQVFILALSLGGGSGAGSCSTMIDILATFGKPIVVMTVLPMANDDAHTKRNALETLSSLAKEVQNKRIHNLIVVDNAKIETIYSEVSQMDFFRISNQAIVEPMDVFNKLSSMASEVKGLDATEWSKLLIDGNGLSVYGQMTIANYQDDTAIADAVIENLNSGLLAGGFDLKQSKYVGIMIVASAKVWANIPSANVDYAMAVVQDLCSVPSGIFKGIYTIDSEDDVVKVYSMFAGLGLPQPRVEQLQKETKEFAVKIKDKEVARNLSLKLETGTEETVSAADKIKQKIAAKNSGFGALLGNSLKKK